LASLRAMQGYDRRWVPTSVGRVHVCERHGQGRLPPLVLMHGLSSAGVHYLRVTWHLKNTSRVVLPDLPGHGFSDMPAKLDGDTLQRGLIESLDAVIQEPAILSGNSLGGYTALRYALARPHKVRALMLAAPAGAGMPAADLEALRARFCLKSHADALAFVDALFHRRKLSRHFYAVGLRKYFALPQTVAVLAALQAAILFTPDELARLSMPILFLWGESERLLPQLCLDFFKQHMPRHTVFEHVPGWGHSGFLDDPKGFAQRLMRFAGDVASFRAPGTRTGTTTETRSLTGTGAPT